MAPRNEPKRVVSRFVILTHPFFTASRMPAGTEVEIAARDYVLKKSRDVWHGLVDRIAAEEEQCSF